MVCLLPVFDSTVTAARSVNKIAAVDVAAADILNDVKKNKRRYTLIAIRISGVVIDRRLLRTCATSLLDMQQYTLRRTYKPTIYIFFPSENLYYVFY